MNQRLKKGKNCSILKAENNNNGLVRQKANKRNQAVCSNKEYMYILHLKHVQIKIIQMI